MLVKMYSFACDNMEIICYFYIRMTPCLLHYFVWKKRVNPDDDVRNKVTISLLGSKLALKLDQGVTVALV